MSQKDGRDYLYLIWKSELSRKQYIVGQLVKNGQYEFRYAENLQDAVDDGFTPLLCFPDIKKYMWIKNCSRFLPVVCQIGKEEIFRIF